MIEPVWESRGIRVFQGDSLELLKQTPDDTYNCAVTSPPYWALRSYLDKDDPLKPLELGSEATPAEYVSNMVDVFRQVRRVLHPTGVLWLNIGETWNSVAGNYRGLEQGMKREDAKITLTGGIGRLANKSYRYGDRKTNIKGHKPGEPVGIPWMLLEGLKRDGWRHRDTIIWSKTSAMPSSVRGWRWERCRVKVADNTRGKEDYRLGAYGNKPQRDHAPDGSFAKAQYIPCPGCPKCEAHGGYRLRKGQWRTTTSHELVFLLVKGRSYFCDAEAVKEAASGDSGWARQRARGQANWAAGTADARAKGAPSSGNEGRNALWQDTSTRNPRSVWTIGPEPLKFAHYAAFPTKLAQKCILAATSSRGRCPQCGVPWSPVVETEVLYQRPPEKGYQAEDARAHRVQIGGNNLGPGSLRDGFQEKANRVLGHRPSCDCVVPGKTPALERARLADGVTFQPEAEPCRVLDPFGGSGTVGVVCARHDLACDLLELNPKYVEYCRRRIEPETRRRERSFF